MSNESNGNKNPKSAKVLKLGFNISVSGDPGSDFEIVLDGKEQKTVDSSLSKDDQFQHFDAVEYPNMDMPNHELEKTKTQEVIHGQSTGAIPKHQKSTKGTHSSESSYLGDSEKTEHSVPKDTNIIDQIKSTMEHFEKFSDHIKEIPRLRNHPVATSTPLSDKYNSKSDSNLLYPEYKSRKFSHYDFYSRKEYFKSSVRPLPPDLFLKPLPAEGYYRRGIYSRFLDLEPYRYFGSDNSLNKSSDYKSICTKSNCDIEKYEECNFPSDPPSGILKKSDSESGDKHSTSSADSIKDIKIYQSGGILIMQNFKDNLDFTEKKELSEFSSKLIENCNKLKMEVSGFQDDIPAIGNSSEENKSLGKMVQFDLSGFEGQKSKSGDSSSAARDESSVRLESSESTSDPVKNKDSSPQGTSHSQDFPSLSTQENDSIVSNQPGMSPSYASSKKLEWDSGADIGYLNLDLTKENLSTIEKIVLKGLSSDSKSEKNVVYEKKSEDNQTDRAKFILERKSSELVIDDGLKDEASNPKAVSAGSKRGSDSGKETEGKVISKGEIRPKSEETKSDDSTARRISTIKPIEVQPKESKGKIAETTDKCVNVNTLFDDFEFRTPVKEKAPHEYIDHSESSAKPKTKRSPKVKISKNKNRLKKAVKKVILPHEKPASLAMGVPKKVYKKIEATPEINDVELSKEVEEIIIDQRFKIKQNVQPGQAIKEDEIVCKDKVDSVVEVKTKARPFSGSSANSSSTILRKFENEEEVKKSTRSKLRDQIIQTSDCDCESVGIQAFCSQKSSDLEFKSLRKTSQKLSEQARETGVNTSSKNIQAFGLNSSLPKQLEHQKGIELVDNQHTKSTQFFGGPLNSLPNYHSNLVTKPGESCGRMPNILKTKKNSEAEIIRLKEENEKNILANDARSESQTDSKRLSNNENKENLISKKSSSFKRSQSSRRNSSKNGAASQDSGTRGGEEKAGKKAASLECSDGPHTSDEVSSMILTSEVLKVHGDSIDRNIIKEKYFQSQMVEFEKRKMISKSTSTEMQMECDATGKEYTTTGCQYSPQSRGTTSGGQYIEPEGDSSKENPNGKTQISSLVQSGSSHNAAEEHFGTAKSTQPGAGDSLPSSTQTAHSWIPGVQNSRENSSGVGRARSFEYLPGHIYESSGNLREELPSESEQNLITSTSDSDTAKGSAGGGGDGYSEGRNTLILENSSESSENSKQLKILDDNLSRLSSALMKFWEKDAQVQSITQSLFMNFWKKSGSGDCLPQGGANSSKTEVGDNEGTQNSDSKVDNTLSGRGLKEPEQFDGKELSMACQTDGKSPPEKFHEGRKALERRISREKKSQIEWIESEIHHLNVLRKLLEKQSNSVNRKQKQASEPKEASKSEELEKGLAEIRPEKVTPVYGCTVILDDSSPQERYYPRMRDRDPYQYQPVYPNASQYPSYSGYQNNWRNVMLSVGVQVSLNDFNPQENGNWEEIDNLPKSTRNVEAFTMTEPCRSDVNTQFPSGKTTYGNSQSANIQTEFSSGKCKTCNRDNCYCLNLSDKSYSSISPSAKSRMSERRGMCCAPCVENGNKTGNSTYRDYGVVEDSPTCHPERTIEQNDRSDFHENYAKHNFGQSTNCKCQNCPRRISSALNKAGITCQSNIHPNWEKHSDDCHCSKVQVQKTTNCGSHIIKIHGSRCCSSERCRRKCCTRKTEDQYCQTDPCNAEYYANQSRSPEARTYGERGNRMFSEADVHTRDKIDAGSCSCGRKAAEKKKPEVEDHPRHYFLKIEETEVDDSTESVEQKKSLEVITVRVPVKKAGKSKIYGSNVLQSTENLKPTTPQLGCSCCSDCIRNRQEQTPNYEPSSNAAYQRRAGKPESLGNSSKPIEEYEEYDNFYDEFIDPSKEPTGLDHRRGRNNEFVRLEPCPSVGPLNEIPEPDCYGSYNSANLNTPPSREFQNEYNSHKKYRNAVLSESRAEIARFHDSGRAERRHGISVERQPQDQSSEYRYRGQELKPEYYNYNKREFMTKSELLKEEEQKRKVHQPTLQESLSSNRPDFFSSAERRREIIAQRAQDRIKKHNNRMECLMSMLQKCNEANKPSNGGSKQIFTTMQMREQTMKRYKKLPEVEGKVADQKKKAEYKTNRLMGEIFAKKLQIEALKGHINLSNSVSVLYTL